MKPVTLVLFAALLVSGCVRRYVTAVAPEPAPCQGSGDEYLPDDAGVEEAPVYEEDAGLPGDEGCEPAWDGHAWIEIEFHTHGNGCGHFFHHSCWNLFAEDHVFVEPGYAPSGETGGFSCRGETWGRVWDGGAFMMLRGHIHGPDCGHFYHDRCWNLFPSGHVYSKPGHRDFCASPPPRSHEARRVESARVGSRNAEPRTRAVNRPAGAEPRIHGVERKEAVRIAQPARREQPKQIEREGRREQPQRIERPERREPPKQIEREGRREQPQRIEQPERHEQPKQTEREEKREQPKRIEQPERREPPKQAEREKQTEVPEKREKDRSEKPGKR